jgi:hypothetical protein
MERLLLVNRRRRTARRRIRNSRRRKGRMPAALKRYWAAKRARMVNPRRRRRRRHVNRRHHHRGLFMARRRRRHANSHRRRHHHRARRRFANRRHHYRMRRRHRNPRSGSAGLNVNSIVREGLVPGAIGAAGALATQYLLGYLTPSLPSSLTSGAGAIGVQAAAAVGVGLAARKFLGRSRGDMVMVGGLVVTAYSLFQSLLSGSSIGMSGLRDFTPYPMRGLGAYMPGVPATSGFGQRTRLGLGRLGYVSPAPVIGPTMSPPQMGAYMNVAPHADDGM